MMSWETIFSTFTAAAFCISLVFACSYIMVVMDNRRERKNREAIDKNSNRIKLFTGAYNTKTPPPVAKRPGDTDG